MSDKTREHWWKFIADAWKSGKVDVDRVFSDELLRKATIPPGPFIIDSIGSITDTAPKRAMTATEAMMMEKLKKTAAECGKDIVLQPSPYNVKGGLNIDWDSLKDKNPIMITSSYVPKTQWSGTAMPAWSKNPPYAITSSWVTVPGKTFKSGGFDDDIDWSGAISGLVGATPVMDATLNVTVNIGDPANHRATVSFRNEELTKMVWLNNNVDVVKEALVAFNHQVISGGAGNPWFNCVCKGVTSTYWDKRVTFHGLHYEEHVIKAMLNHRVDHEGEDPMKVMAEIASTHKFFVVGDMEVDEDEGMIESLVIRELWKYNPQRQENELIFKV